MKNYPTPHRNLHNQNIIESRRRFLFGTIAAGAIGLTGCGESQTVQVAVESTPTPTPTPTAAPMPSLPPLEQVTLSANYKNALMASDEIVNHFAKTLDTPSALIHAVRAFGKNFKRADGSSAVDHLFSRYGEETTVNGKRFVRFTRFNVEVHENSFLKTFIEAGVNPEQPLVVGNNKYTLKDLGEHAKQLFRFDPGNLGRYEKDYSQEHLPWGIIAFAFLMPGGQGTWENAYGEKIQLIEVLDKALAEFESTCQPVKLAKEKQEPIPDKSFHYKFKVDFPCYGGHSIYSFLAGLKNGYTDRNLKARLQSQIDLDLYRMVHECDNVEKDYADAVNKPISPNPQENAMYDQQMVRAGVSKADVVGMVTLRAIVKLTGHILEAVNFARLNGLFELSAEQQKLLQTGEQKLFDSIVKIRALNLEALKIFNAKQLNDTIIALGHASRAMKLLTPDNPDKNPKAI